MQQRRQSQLSGTRHLMYFYHHQTSLTFCCVLYQTCSTIRSFAHHTVSRLRLERDTTFLALSKCVPGPPCLEPDNNSLMRPVKAEFLMLCLVPDNT